MATNDEFRYATAGAFRAALTDRLKIAAAGSPFTVAELQRQFSYDRLLARVFTAPDADRWVLKGAVCLLVRLDVARHSRDVDLAWQAARDHAEAERSLRAAVARDVGDFFAFVLGEARPLAEGKGIRVPVVANLGRRQLAAFSIDVVGGLTMTAAPDTLPALAPVDIPGLVHPPYRVCPLVDHIADKLSACMETRVRSNGTISPSTRYRDLVDLMLIARTQRIDAAALRIAVLSEAARRGVAPPVEFDVPTGTWVRGYEAIARAVPDLGDLARFGNAMALVKRLLDPILTGTATGHWDQASARWR